MTVVFLLLVLGLLFIVMEFYLPGAIMGTIGGVMLVVSVFMFAGISHSLLVDLLYLSGVIALVAIVIQCTLKKIPRSKSRFNIYLNEDQEGFYASKYDQTAIGKEGVVMTDLKPGGYVLVEGKKHQAISQSGYLSTGDKVLVIGGQEESLIVQKRD